ncbi:flagellar hook-associated protein FlgK [Rhizobium sp. BK251]|uniref:flagellar hook-associated protein FlgK n=1 Tax=Rhizobium sp. BK251 TaxID=2512125 RepID=UPI0010520F4D|nr:flagellar hook-associated protein FlgK [Rhizobium sp. BK251]TCL75641.1 flagellar hook-associated protein 1 FlgK [Rhizobium sp. BK251]
MSLTSALNTAQSIFNNTGTQSSVVSNNIANAGNADYVRRQAMISTSLNGAQVVRNSRAQEEALQRQFLDAKSADAAQQRLLKGLTDIKATLGGNDYETSPATYLSELQDALQTFAASPGSITAAQSAVTAAQDVANSLNKASTSIQTMRTEADKEISTAVDNLNGLLSEFKLANDAVKAATATGGDPNDALDRRDALLKQISQIVGIKTYARANNDIAIYTNEGITLFETIPRTVSFQSTNAFSADGPAGNAVYIDGVAVGAGKGANTTGQGTIQALLQMRDEVIPTYQSQLDEIARGLVNMFSETGGTPPTTLPGLFTWGGAPASTTGGTIIDGIAASIKVAGGPTGVITSEGGDPMRLRDGGINGTAYDKNPPPNKSSGYSDQLDAFISAMGTKMAFDPAAGVDSNATIMDFASNSIGWVEDKRSNATAAAENSTAQLSRSNEAYSNETGVNLDEELSLLLDIEQSYKAATKILNAVDEMLKSLLEIAS